MSRVGRSKDELHYFVKSVQEDIQYVITNDFTSMYICFNSMNSEFILVFSFKMIIL